MARAKSPAGTTGRAGAAGAATGAGRGALTVDGLKAWALENRDLAMAVVTAQAFAQVQRARVDAYIAPIFARYGFTDADDGEPIKCYRQLYLSNDDARCAEFYAECDRAHRAHGFDGPEGHCPALVAEDLAIQAENALLRSLAECIGVSGFPLMDARKRALELTLGVCIGGVK